MTTEPTGGVGTRSGSPDRFLWAAILLPFLAMVLVVALRVHRTPSKPPGTPGRAYVSNELSGSVSVVDTDIHKVIRTLDIADPRTTSGPPGELRIGGIALSPDGGLAYVLRWMSSAVWVLDTGEGHAATGGALIEGVQEPASGIAVSPDGSKLYVPLGTGRCVSVIDTVRNEVEDCLLGGSFPTRAGFARQGRELFVVDTEGGIVWGLDGATHEVRHRLRTGRPLGGGLAVSPAGDRVFVTEPYRNSVTVVTTATGAVTDVPVGAKPTSVSLTPNGAFAYVTNAEGDDVSVLRADTNAVVRKIRVGRMPIKAAVTPDGSLLYVVNHHDNSLSVVETASNRVVATVEVGLRPMDVAISAP